MHCNVQHRMRLNFPCQYSPLYCSEEAQKAKAQGNMKVAADLYALAIDIGPATANLYFLHAHALVKLGNLNGACFPSPTFLSCNYFMNNLSCLTSTSITIICFERNKHNNDVCFITIYDTLIGLAEALEDLEKALQLDQTMHEAYLLKGSVTIFICSKVLYIGTDSNILYCILQYCVHADPRLPSCSNGSYTGFCL
uniref:Uncharacterized protein n=1 Tax=Arundo donax TaxID=35708 RepID=A0A0A9CH18_ARUDO